jgi:hypothetical protein
VTEPRPRRAPIFALLALVVLAAAAGAGTWALGAAGEDARGRQAESPRPDRSEEDPGRSDAVAEGERRPREPAPVPPSSAPTPTPNVQYEQFASTEAGYQTEVPSSWTNDKETTDDGSDVLYRSTWSGPDGTELLIDATPTVRPAPPPSAGSSDTVSQPAFGTAREYVFSGGSLPQCAERCVLYQIVDGDGGGYAVLAGGGQLATARTVARHAALELAPPGGSTSDDPDPGSAADCPGESFVPPSSGNPGYCAGPEE